MSAPLTVVEALTVRASPVLHPALIEGPPVLRTFVDAVPAGLRNENLWTARPPTLSALAAFAALGTVPRLASRMSLPRNESFCTSDESIALRAILVRVTFRALMW